MYKVRINGEPVSLPFASELTVKDYIEISEREKFTVMDFISMFARMTYTHVLNSNINDYSLRIIIDTIKQIKPFDYYTSLPRQDFFKFRGKIIDLKTLNNEAVGLRLLVEQNADKLNTAPRTALYVFSCLLSKDFDAGQADEIQAELMLYTADSVFRAAGFFLKRFSDGYNNGGNLWKKYRNILARG